MFGRFTRCVDDQAGRRRALEYTTDLAHQRISSRARRSRTTRRHSRAPFARSVRDIRLGSARRAVGAHHPLSRAVPPRRDDRGKPTA